MEQSHYAIHIAPHRCAGCYRCVRACSCGAIVIRNQRAAIAQEECTRCGACRKACPHGMISLRDDVESVRRLLKNSDTVFASLDPAWVGEFAGIAPQRMIEALILLGFKSVGETLLGRIAYDKAAEEQLQRHPRRAISTVCPVVVRLIRHHYPEQAERLLPVAHPAVLHARMIRRWHGQGSKVVYITPCVAAKSNPDEISELDAVITFGELRRWMREEGVEFDLIPGNDSYRFEPGEADYTPPRIAAPLTCSGMAAVRELLAGEEAERSGEAREARLLELLGCTGGCAGAADSQQGKERHSIVDKIGACDRFYRERTLANPVYKLPFIATVAAYPAQPAERFRVAASQIEAALASIGKSAERDMPNCSGCGYETCREFARALCIGRAEPEMCLSYTRALAQKKSSVLLEHLASGVLFVDAELRIVEANRQAARLLGPQAEQLFDSHRGLSGVAVETLAPLGDLLRQALNSDRETIEQDLRLKGKLLHLSAFPVETHRSVGVLIGTLRIGSGENDEMVRRTRQVIRENLETVQQIAWLLGENASRTEAILNSIVTAADDDRSE